MLDADEVTVSLADGSTSTLADTTSYADDDEAPARCSARRTSRSPARALSVAGNGNDGIVSKDGLLIESGTITVTSVDDGIRGKDYVVVDGGDVTVDAAGDAIKSDATTTRPPATCWSTTAR